MNHILTAADPALISDPAQMVNIMLEIERPPTDELEAYPREERYRRLRANSEEHRRRLKDWLDTQHLTDEVALMSPATGFNLLFVKCTPHAAQALVHAPGVVEMMYTDDAAEILQRR